MANVYAPQLHLPQGTPLRGVRVNQKFMKSLYAYFYVQPFTNKDAYQVYCDRHVGNSGWFAEQVRSMTPKRRAQWRQGQTGDVWTQANVRCQLITAARRSILVKDGVGLYHFEKEPI